MACMLELCPVLQPRLIADVHTNVVFICSPRNILILYHLTAFISRC